MAYTTAVLSWSVENYVMFKQAEWKVQPGVTFVLGRNRNRPSDQASNASGKSVLMGALPSALLDTHSIGMKSAKAVQRKMYGKGSGVSVTLKRGKSTYVYSKVGSKVTLTKDGKDLHSRVARESIRKLMPLTEEEFFSTVYVDGRRYASFLLGSAADRAAFITKLFRLDDIDVTRKWITQQINSLRERSAAAAIVRTGVDDLLQRLRDYPKTNDAKIDSLTSELSDLQQQTTDLQTVLQQHSAYNVYRKAKQQLDDCPEPSMEKDEAESCVQSHQKWRAKHDAWTERKEEMSQRRDELSKLKVTKRHARQYEKAVAIRDRARSLQCDKPKSMPEVEGDDELIDSLPALRKQESKLESQLDRLTNIRKHVSKLDGSCPTCLRPLKDHDKNGVLKALDREIEDVERAYKRASKRVNEAEAYSAYKDHRKAMMRWEKYQSYVKAIEGYPFKDVDKYLRLSALLSESLGPEPKEPKGDLQAAKKAIAAYQRRRELGRILKGMKTDGKPDMSLKTAKSKLETVNARIREIMTSLPKLKSLQQTFKQDRRQYNAEKRKLAELSEGLDDLPVYELLQGAYSAKGDGIKTMILAALARRLEKNLNVFAKHVFEEGYQFSLTVAPNQFDVIVNRRNGKSSDIRYFSGAESRLFAVVFLLALLPMIPSSRRMNLLILDEPTANMDTPSRDVFREVLLPQLAKIVPSVIVASPNIEDMPHGTRAFTVVKQQTKATLHSGVVK